MATGSIAPDALLALRHSIATNNPPILTTTSESASATNTTQSLSLATHLQFHHASGPQQILPLSAPTRFESSGKALDLRSILFAWQKKDDAIPDYLDATRKLNEELAEEGAVGGTVQNLVFTEKLDLITWLEGASEESEHIQPLDEETAKAQAQAESAAGIASGATGGAATAVQSGPGGTASGRTVDPRLREIYNMERKMGDRNTVLRGIKPTVCGISAMRRRRYVLTFAKRTSRMYENTQKIFWARLGNRAAINLLLLHLASQQHSFKVEQNPAVD